MAKKAATTLSESSKQPHHFESDSSQFHLETQMSKTTQLLEPSTDTVDRLLSGFGDTHSQTGVPSLFGNDKTNISLFLDNLEKSTDFRTGNAKLNLSNKSSFDNARETNNNNEKLAALDTGFTNISAFDDGTGLNTLDLLGNDSNIMALIGNENVKKNNSTQSLPSNQTSKVDCSHFVTPNERRILAARRESFSSSSPSASRESFAASSKSPRSSILPKQTTAKRSSPATKLKSGSMKAKTTSTNSVGAITTQARRTTVTPNRPVAIATRAPTKPSSSMVTLQNRKSAATKSSPSMVTLQHQSNTSANKKVFALRLIPSTPELQLLMEQNGYNPHLELVVRPKKRVVRVVEHLQTKWSRVGGLFVQTIRLALASPVAQSTNKSWGVDDSEVMCSQLQRMCTTPSDLVLKYSWSQPKTGHRVHSATKSSTASGSNLCQRNSMVGGGNISQSMQPQQMAAKTLTVKRKGLSQMRSNISTQQKLTPIRTNSQPTSRTLSQQPQRITKPTPIRRTHKTESTISKDRSLTNKRGRDIKISAQQSTKKQVVSQQGNMPSNDTNITKQQPISLLDGENSSASFLTGAGVTQDRLFDSFTNGDSLFGTSFSRLGLPTRDGLETPKSQSISKLDEGNSLDSWANMDISLSRIQAPSSHC